MSAGGRRPAGPLSRVRPRVRAACGAEVADRLPGGFQRLGSVVILRLPDGLRPYYEAIGKAWCSERGIRTVLVRSGPISGEFRRPGVERIAGDGAPTIVAEHGVRYRLDAERIMFAEGNQDERRRAGALVRPNETFVDLFAGIGYFTIPGLVHGRAGRAIAVEKNPLAHRYLVENLELNAVARRASALLGDNREVPLPAGEADRVFLGYLPSSLPWIGRALELLRPEGGALHVHLVADARAPLSEAEATVRDAVEREGGGAIELAAREVKPYGPGRRHIVVDARVTPPRR